jgi:hypothetical protein
MVWIQSSLVWIMKVAGRDYDLSCTFVCRRCIAINSYPIVSRARMLVLL